MKESIVTYKGKVYTEDELKKIIDYYNEFRLYGGETECPLCNCELKENDRFCCHYCQEIKPCSELCDCHYEEYDVCMACCEDCQRETAFINAIEQAIDYEIEERLI